MMTLKEFVTEKYWPVVVPGLDPAWRERVERWVLPCILDDLGKKHINTLTSETVEIWWGRQRTRHKANATANKCLMRLKHMLSKLVQWGYLPKSPAEHLKKLKEPSGRVKWLSPKQRDTLITKANPRLRGYVLGALYTGGRRRSLFELREKNLDLVKGLVTFPKTKNGEDLTLPVHPVLKAYLETTLTGDPEAKVFNGYKDPMGVSQAFRRLAKRTGLIDFRFHDQRHDLGTRLAMNGANQRVIMDVLGHKDPRMSLRYTHVSQEKLREELGKV